MDDTVREAITALAEEYGIDPEYLLQCLSMGTMPVELREAVSAALGDVDLFDRALSEARKKA